VGDIAFALAHINRFNGHVGRYNVAAHSLVVVAIASELSDAHPRIERQALLHDSSEAYLNDLARDVKYVLGEMQPHLGWNPYVLLEARVSCLIYEKYKCSLPDRDVQLIKDADNLALAAEVHALWPKEHWPHFGNPAHNPEHVELVFDANRLKPRQAERLFLERFAKLAYEEK
jgi:5'-deoxynucleotidase YfbR-like HD superfamily hydrolase